MTGARDVIWLRDYTGEYFSSISLFFFFSTAFSGELYAPPDGVLLVCFLYAFIFIRFEWRIGLVENGTFPSLEPIFGY